MIMSMSASYISLPFELMEFRVPYKLQYQSSHYEPVPLQLDQNPQFLTEYRKGPSIEYFSATIISIYVICRLLVKQKCTNLYLYI